MNKISEIIIVYVYYGIDTRDVILFDFEYQKGTLSKDSVFIYPDQRAVVDETGCAPLLPSMYKDKKKLLIISESHFYKNKLSSVSWFSSNDKIIQINVFGPYPEKEGQ